MANRGGIKHWQIAHGNIVEAHLETSLKNKLDTAEAKATQALSSVQHILATQAANEPIYVFNEWQDFTGTYSFEASHLVMITGLKANSAGVKTLELNGQVVAEYDVQKSEVGSFVRFNPAIYVHVQSGDEIDAADGAEFYLVVINQLAQRPS